MFSIKLLKLGQKALQIACMLMYESKFSGEHAPDPPSTLYAFGAL